MLFLTIWSWYRDCQIFIDALPSIWVDATVATILAFLDTAALNDPMMVLTLELNNLSNRRQLHFTVCYFTKIVLFVWCAYCDEVDTIHIVVPVCPELMTFSHICVTIWGIRVWTWCITSLRGYWGRDAIHRVHGNSDVYNVDVFITMPVLIGVDRASCRRIRKALRRSPSSSWLCCPSSNIHRHRW